MAARLLAASPLQMVCLSMAAGVIAAISGVWLSYQHNLSTGPSVVLAAVAVFLLSLVAGKLLNRAH